MSSSRLGSWASAVIAACALQHSAVDALAGECSIQPQVVEIATAAGDTIPSDGGILVAATRASSVTTFVAPAIAKWQLVDGAQRKAPTIQTLAPGLTLLLGAGTRLENELRGKLREFARGKTPGPAIAAPVVTRVIHSTPRTQRKTVTSVTVELARPAEAAHFLVVFDKTGKAARSFGQATPKSRAVLVFQAGECVTQPDGTTLTQPTDEVTLAWVDVYGRMSPRSRVVVVTDAPE